MFEEFDLISSYSRAQAIDDGVLVDVSGPAQEAGIKFPVALTRAAWARYVEVPRGVQCQDESGRLWDLLWMLRCAVQQSTGGPVLHYRVHVRNDNRNRTPPPVTLKAVCGPNDDGSPCITVMLPDED